MAKFDNGILGSFSGKIGPVVGVNNNGTFYMRSAPSKRTKFTDKELINQAKFKLVQDYLQPIKEIITVGFKNYFTKHGGYRAAMAYTRKYALVEDDAGFYIDPSLFKISGGNLATPYNTEINFDDANNVTITWDNNLTEDSNAADQLMVLLYNSTSKSQLSYIFNGAFRDKGIFTIAIPLDLQQKEVDVYIGFIAADRSFQSDSQYLGRFDLDR